AALPGGTAVELSVVLPVYNEAENLPELHAILTAVLSEFGRSYELLSVADGSSDHSFEVLRELQQADSHLRVIRLRRNFGQTPAMSAGFRFARGRIIMPMDAHLQNDPRDIPRLVAKIEEGYDVVSGWRVNRRDTFLTRRVPSMLANWLIGR